MSLRARRVITVMAAGLACIEPASSTDRRSRTALINEQVSGAAPVLTSRGGLLGWRPRWLAAVIGAAVPSTASAEAIRAARSGAAVDEPMVISGPDRVLVSGRCGLYGQRVNSWVNWASVAPVSNRFG
jgi:hypothetical protein